MKKTLLILCLASSFCFAQNATNDLKFKFNEKEYLSNLLTSTTQNTILTKVIAQSDSAWAKNPSQDYSSVFSKYLTEKAKKTNDKDASKLSQKDKAEWESLKTEIAKIDLTEMYQDVINRTFNDIFLKSVLVRNNIRDFSISKPSFNQFVISFSSEADLKSATNLFKETGLAIFPMANTRTRNGIFSCIQNQMKKKKIENGKIASNYLQFPNEEQVIYRNNFKDLRNTCSSSDNSLSYFAEIPKGQDYETNIYVGKKINSDLIFKNLIFTKAIYDISYKGKEQITEEQATEYRKNDKIIFSLVENKTGADMMQKLLNSNKDNAYILAKSNGDFMVPIQKIDNQKDGKFGFEINASQYYWENIYQDLLFEAFKNSLTIQ